MPNSKYFDDVELDNFLSVIDSKVFKVTLKEDNLPTIYRFVTGETERITLKLKTFNSDPYIDLTSEVWELNEILTNYNNFLTILLVRAEEAGRNYVDDCNLSADPLFKIDEFLNQLATTKLSDTSIIKLTLSENDFGAAVNHLNYMIKAEREGGNDQAMIHSLEDLKKTVCVAVQELKKPKKLNDRAEGWTVFIDKEEVSLGFVSH